MKQQLWIVGMNEFVRKEMHSKNINLTGSYDDEIDGIIIVE